jgi:hypothetical protein
MATQTPLDAQYAWRAAWDFGNGKDVAPVRVEEAVHVRIRLDRSERTGRRSDFLD